MVVIEGVKYACEACIKGHRSSSCSHTDRPLYEIKKKGRPITQCEHCRQLRRTKQVHIKCSCEDTANSGETVPIRGKTKRRMPTTPAFPEGISGSMSSASSRLTPSMTQRKLKGKSCDCDSLGECDCATPLSTRASSASTSAPSAPATPQLPAAPSCCKSENKSDFSLGNINSGGPHAPGGLVQGSPPTLMLQGDGNIPSTFPLSDSYLAPLISDYTPPFGAGIGMCSCGISCTCPGCAERLILGESCPNMCSTCIDCDGFNLASSASSAPIFPQNTVWDDVTAWSEPPAVAALPPTPDCCGGSCKCTADSLSCKCEETCCGCCFGCACSGSESDLAEEGLGKRVEFAVSRERGSCKDCSADKEADGRTNKRRKIRQNDSNPTRKGTGVTFNNPFSLRTEPFPAARGQ